MKTSVLTFLLPSSDCRDLAHVLINITTAFSAILSHLNHASCKTDVFCSLVKWITVCPASWPRSVGTVLHSPDTVSWKCSRGDDEAIGDKSGLQVSLQTLFLYTDWWNHFSLDTHLVTLSFILIKSPKPNQNKNPSLNWGTHTLSTATFVRTFNDIMHFVAPYLNLN